MSKYVRMKHLDSQVKDHYKVDVEVSHRPISRDAYEIKLNKGNKEVVLTEVMKRGRTDFALLKYDGTVNRYEKYHQAEEAAIEILRS